MSKTKHPHDEELQHLPPDDDENESHEPVEQQPSDAPAEGVRREGVPPAPPTDAPPPPQDLPKDEEEKGES